MKNLQKPYKKLLADVIERLRYHYDHALNVKELEAIIHNEDAPKETYYYLAQSYQALQKHKKADIYFEEASKWLFNYPKLYLNWANNNAEFSKKSALEIVEKGIALFPKNKQLYIHRAWICKDKKTQIIYFEELKTLFPANVEILEQRVEYFLNEAPKTLKNRLELVIEDCHKLIEIDEKNESYTNNLAWTYFYKKDYQKAESILLVFWQKYKNQNIAYSLTNVYENIKEYDKAINFLKESLAIQWNINLQISVQ